MTAARTELGRPGRLARGLAHVGGVRAASAFGMLVGRPLRAGEPRVCETSGSAAIGAAETGVIFEMQGDLRGLVAVLLSEAACQAVLAGLTGPDPDPDRVDSALRELGNIVASQAVSGMADYLGAKITISLPILVHDEAGRVLDQMLTVRRSGADGAVTTIEIGADGGVRGGLLVVAPDASEAP